MRNRPSSDRGQGSGRHGAPTRRPLAHPEGNHAHVQKARLHLTVDTATPAGPVRSWPAASRTPAGNGPHSDET
ncbi:hypothetical protein PV721_10640 [Streptomyces sp. MB09-01]|uniref:hypothetical protein n=1 Tax=Streptomyces sp. MB09-01 TaxID=3028666 RepID=UPI0029A9B5C2|nr:hypothetical protein [Streptomyces sp. MB09-01]MDX3534821.1 hypothetical protein [Streptomyces sp. MB09-01]